jgi:hypothetical protein
MTKLAAFPTPAGSAVDIGFDFERTLAELTVAGEVDSYLVGTEDGFSPLGAARSFLADELGRTEGELRQLANWNRFENDRVSLVACPSLRPGGRLRGVALAPCENSRAYTRFAATQDGRPSRDFYDNVSYEGLVLIDREWGGRRVGVSHLSASGNFHEDIAACTAETLIHLCSAPAGSGIRSLNDLGCCVSPAQLMCGLQILSVRALPGQHRSIRTTQEDQGTVTLIHLDWSGGHSAGG